MGKTFLCFVIYHLFPLPISSDGDQGGGTPLASSLLTKVQSYNKFAT